METKLPTDFNKIVSVQYHYEDGSVFETDGKQSAVNYLNNIASTTIMALRGHIFCAVRWLKIK